MNWDEFLRTLTWIWAVVLMSTALLTLLLGSIATSDGYKCRGVMWLTVSGVALIIAAVLFSIIGGMNWGLTQQ